MAESEIARLRQQQELEEQAAKQGLYELAMVGSHAIITAHVQRGAERILHLLREGKHEEAKTLMDSPGWGVEDQKMLPSTAAPLDCNREK
jgi:hypothetical protein